MDKDIVPFDSLIGVDGHSPNPSVAGRKLIEDAQIILAVDVMSGRESVLWGANLHRMITANAIHPPLDVVTLRVGLDEGDLNQLVLMAAIVEVVKGRENRRAGRRMTRDEMKVSIKDQTAKGTSDSALAMVLGLSADDLAELKAEILSEGH